MWNPHSSKNPAVAPSVLFWLSAQGQLGLLNPRIRTLDTETLKADAEMEREQRKCVINVNQSVNYRRFKITF